MEDVGIIDRTIDSACHTIPAPTAGFAELRRHLQNCRIEVASEWYEKQFSAQMHSEFPNEYAEKASRDVVIERHLLPMLDLLAEYARTGDSIYRDLYLAERKRYAPHRQGRGTLRRYFSVVIPMHEEALARRLPASLRSILSALHEPLTQSAPKCVRMLAIGDCLLTNVTGFAQSCALREGIELDLRQHYFSARTGAALADEGVVSAIKDGIDLIAVSYLSYEGIPPYRLLLNYADRGELDQLPELVDGIAGYIRDHLLKLRELTDAPILLHNAGGLPLTRWRQALPFLVPLNKGRRAALRLVNEAIADIGKQIENCFLVDEVQVVQREGFRRCATRILPRRMWRNAHLHPEYLSRYLADSYMGIVRDYVRLRKTKLLLVDFDNTLWDGVMAEGHVAHFHDRQELLKQLAEQGILLAAVSKNDSANIRWKEMGLAPRDFVLLKISWNMKVQSIREIAAELNLGLDSFVLLDDSPAERGMVQSELPEVLCLDSQDAGTWESLKRLFRMPNTRQTEEARKRTQMYREQAARQGAAKEAGGSSAAALMARLELKSAVGPARHRDKERLLELVQRTNQFNTTTVRYSKSDIEAAMSAPDTLVLVGDLADKFGDLGLVCAAIVRQQGAEAVIENFVMSCRAMGFGMEQLMLSQILARVGVKPLVGKFVPTARNEPASTLFSSAGFVEESKGTWRAPKNIGLEPPGWISLEARN